MDKYELMFITNANLESELLEETKKQVSAFFDEVINLDSWGTKEFTYPIKKEIKGNYFVLIGKISADNILKLKEYFKFSKEVLRHLLLNIDKENNHPLNTKAEKNV